MSTKITWDRKESRVWTAIIDVRFDRGLLTSTRPVAFRIAPERMPECTGRYVVDRKSMAILPWENASGTRTFGTKAEAVRFTATLVTEMGKQNEWHPKL